MEGQRELRRCDLIAQTASETYAKTERTRADPERAVPQFDRSEFAKDSPGGPFCRECRGPIRDEYYDVGGIVVCSICHMKRGRARGRLIRCFKALLFGSLAAAVGAGIYRAIMFGTGWNFSLVAVLVGYMVGGAVKTGSGERGGRFYQFLAMFLTYSALVGMFVPELWQALGSSSKKGKEAENQIEKEIRQEVKTDPGRNADAKLAENSALPKAEARPVAAASKPALEAEAKSTPAAHDLKGRPEDAGERRRPRGAFQVLYLLVMLLLTLILLIGLIYAVPLLVAIHSPISLFIFGIALWQAWMMTRAVDIPVTGPYRIRG